MEAVGKAPDWKVAGSSPRGRNFFSRVNSLCCANSYSMSVPPHVTARKRLRSLCKKCRWQVTPKHTYTHDPTKSEWAEYAVQVHWGNLSGKWAHMQPVREHSTTVISARWATVDWSWPTKWNWCACADLHLKKATTKKSRWGIHRTFPKSPHKRGKSLHKEASSQAVKNRGYLQPISNKFVHGFDCSTDCQRFNWPTFNSLSFLEPASL